MRPKLCRFERAREMVILGKRRSSSPSTFRVVDGERRESNQDHSCNSSNPFQGVNALFLSGGVSARRLQIWKERVKGLGGFVAEPSESFKRRFTHVLASDYRFFKKDDIAHKFRLSSKVFVVKYEWVEDCLKEGKLLPCDPYQLSDTLSPSSPSIETDKFSSTVGLRGPAIDENEHPSTSKDLDQDMGKVRGACLMSDKPNSLIDVEANHQAVELDFNELDELDALPHSEDENGCNLNKAIDVLTSSDLPSVNNHIIQVLREMWDIYESVLGDEWRALTYRKAAIRLERLTCRISNIEDVKHIPGIGSSMVEKIREILCTGRLQKLDNLKADPKVQTLQHLASVWGVGPKLAQKLYQFGHRTVDDLQKEPSLSQMARIGVMHYKDLVLRIPRYEVAAAEKYVQGVAEDLCPEICLRVAGSYRRGNPTCGDIDFLVTHPDGYSHRGFLVKLVEKLQTTGFITEGLHCTDHSSEAVKKVDTFMGVGRVPGYVLHRRIDIKVYPKEAYAFALVYFTGNDVLNRKIRYAAQRKGFKLNDQGLYHRFGGKKGISSTECIPCETEEDVFSKIGFPYYEPHERNL